ncbi:MAG: hypothetical protein ACRC91_09840 [Aeromonas sp.]
MNLNLAAPEHRPVPHPGRVAAPATLRRTTMHNMTPLSAICAAALALGPSTAWSAPFFGQLVLQDVTFQVESPNQGSSNRVTIRASTPNGSMKAEEADVEGTITGMEIDDLDANGYPEIYVYITSPGSGAYGSLLAYASNRNQSITPIYLPPLNETPAVNAGYMGHDRFAVGEGRLIRHFPIYRQGDTNAKPSGGTRQIQYRLEAGEAGWRLKQDKTFDLPK